MTTARTRNARQALGVAIMLWLALTGHATSAADGPTWFRGQLHAHTYWSDGHGFPEQAIDAYKQRGYQFLSLTDHNQFAEDTNVWIEVAAQGKSKARQVSQSMVDAVVGICGRDWVQTRTDGPATSVRLRTYAELKARFEKAGTFLLLPGVELTQVLNGSRVHLNCINLPVTLPCIKGSGMVKALTGSTTASELIALNASEAAQAAAELQRPYVLMLNHPFRDYYDFAPQDLLDRPEVRFFEICNHGSHAAPHPEALTYTLETFWDAVNAFRLLQGHPLLYGVGSDDAHAYDAKGASAKADVGDAWIMVRSRALTPEDLMAAMHRGDFYATCGVLLEDLSFTPERNTLRVTVKAEPGVRYRIDFITTKRGFDRTVTGIASPADGRRPARTIPVYSADVGRVAKTVAGTEADYRLEPDDLYVRARVESDSPSQIAPHFHPKMKTAWTQPYAATAASAGKTD